MDFQEIQQGLLPLVGPLARTVRRDFYLKRDLLEPSIRVCQICCAPAQGYLQCYQCYVRQQSFGTELADAVVPLSYAVKNNVSFQQFNFDLHRYKDASPSFPAGIRLRALLRMFRFLHLDCLESNVGQSVNAVIAVPSGRNRPNHPLPLIAEMLDRQLLPARYIGTTRTFRTNNTNPDDFVIDGQPYGHVVVLEDTWVQGNNAQSLAIKARRCGAERVSIVVLARMLDYQFPPTKVMVDTWLHPDHFDPFVCPVPGVCLRDKTINP